MKYVVAIVISLAVCSNAYGGYGSFVPRPLGDMSGLKVFDGSISAPNSISPVGTKFETPQNVKVMAVGVKKQSFALTTQKGIKRENVDVAAIRRKAVYLIEVERARQRKEAKERETAPYMKYVTLPG